VKRFRLPRIVLLTAGTGLLALLAISAAAAQPPGYNVLQEECDRLAGQASRDYQRLMQAQGEANYYRSLTQINQAAAAGVYQRSSAELQGLIRQNVNQINALNAIINTPVDQRGPIPEVKSRMQLNVRLLAANNQFYDDLIRRRAQGLPDNPGDSWLTRARTDALARLPRLDAQVAALSESVNDADASRDRCRARLAQMGSQPAPFSFPYGESAGAATLDAFTGAFLPGNRPPAPPPPPPNYPPQGYVPPNAPPPQVPVPPPAPQGPRLDSFAGRYSDGIMGYRVTVQGSDSLRVQGALEGGAGMTINLTRCASQGPVFACSSEGTYNDGARVVTFAGPATVTPTGNGARGVINVASSSTRWLDPQSANRNPTDFAQGSVMQLNLVKNGA